ncbi:MAG: CBS domain-containing protein [Verrucomicrobiota bacterium]
MTEILFLVALAGAWALALMETALLAASPVRFRYHAKKGEPHAARLARLLETRSSALLVAGPLKAIFLALALWAAFENWGQERPLVAFLLLLLILLGYVVGVELFGKAFARQRPHRLLTAFRHLLQVSHFLGQLFRGKQPSLPPPPPSYHRKERLLAVAREYTEGASSELELIENALEFAELKVNDFLIPLGKVTSIPLEMPIPSLLPIARRTRHRYFPVLDHTGQPAGTVSMHEIVRARSHDRTGRDFLRKRVTVRQDQSAESALLLLRRRGNEIGIVVNARQVPVGIVTVTDLVKRLLKV